MGKTYRKKKDSWENKGRKEKKQKEQRKEKKYNENIYSQCYF